MRAKSMLTVVVFLTLLLVEPAPRSSEATEPVRLLVETDKTEVRSGETIDLRVGLQDAVGETAKAPRDLVIELLVGVADEQSKKIELRLHEGESGANLEIETGSPGLFEIQAEHPELRSGGTYFRVKQSSPVASASPDRHGGLLSVPARTVARNLPSELVRLKQARPAALRALPEETADRNSEPAEFVVERYDSSPTMDDAAHRSTEQADSIEISRFEGKTRVFQLPQPEPAMKSAAMGAQTVARLRATPQRGLLANGKDSAKIFTFLDGENETGFIIQLVSDTGRLDPIPISVEPGETSAQALLTASQPGTVSVEYVMAKPVIGDVEPRSLQVEFEPPIASLRVATHPSSIRAGETADVVVRLVDADLRPIRTLRDRDVKFSLGIGRGTLREKSQTISANSFEARTEFSAEWPGDATVIVASPNLLTQSASLEVAFPWDILLLTAIGALAGGLIAWTHGRGKGQWLLQRLFTGFVAGLVLYWLLLYFGITPRAALSNPLGVIVAAVIGGWLGTEVFDFAIGWLGLRKPLGASEAGGAPGE